MKKNIILSLFLFAANFCFAQLNTAGQQIKKNADQSPDFILQSGTPGYPDIATYYPFGEQYLQARTKDNEGRRTAIIRSKYYPGAGDLISPLINITHFGGTIVIWDAITGLEIRRLNAGAVVIAISLPVNGTRLLSLDDGGHAILWDMASGKKLLQFDDGLVPVVLSPDGNSIAMSKLDSASQKFITSVYDIKSKKIILKLDTNNSAPLVIEFSKDAKVILSVASDKIKAWDANNGKLIFSQYRKGLEEAAFSNDGKRIISTGYEKIIHSNVIMMSSSGSTTSRHRTKYFNTSSTDTVKTDSSIYFVDIWNVAGSNLVASIKGHEKFRSVQLSPDNKLVLIIADNIDPGDFDNKAFVYDGFTGKEIGQLVCQPNPPVTVPGSNSDIYSISDDFYYPPKNITSATFSSDSRYIAVGNFDGRIVVTKFGDTTGNNYILKNKEDFRNNTIQDLLFYPDSHKFLGLIGHNGNYKSVQIDVNSGEITNAFSFNRTLSPITSIAFAGDKSGVLIQRSYGAELWDMKETGLIVRSFDSKHLPVLLSGDGKTMIDHGLFTVDDRTHQIVEGFSNRCYNSLTGEVISEIKHLSRCYAKTFSTGGQLLYAGYDGDTVKVWDAHSGNQLSVTILKKSNDKDRRPGYVDNLELTPDGKTLVATSNNGNCTVFSMDAKTLAVENTFDIGPGRGDEFGLVSYDFSGDSKHIIFGSSDGRAFLVDLTGKEALRSYNLCTNEEIYHNKVKKIAFINDSLSFFAITEQGFAGSRNKDDKAGALETRHREVDIRPLGGHVFGFASMTFPINTITDFALSTDKKTVVTAGADGTARIWRTTTGGEIKQLEIGLPVLSLALSPDGHYLLTGSLDGVVKIWDISDEKKEVCTLISNNAVLSYRLGKYFPEYNEQCLVISPDGRFDSNFPQLLKDTHWVFQDAPFKTLPSEIFMRDYYTPRLLSRIFSGDTSLTANAHPDLYTLNRAQPKIVSMNIQKEASADLVDITVTLSSQNDTLYDNGRMRITKSGIYDLRLFRNGRLVGEKPDTAVHYLQNQYGNTNFDGAALSQWQRMTQIGDGQHNVYNIAFKGIKIPHLASSDTVTFSAYAFNSDRVRSETYDLKYVPHSLPVRPGRVFLISMGVSKSQKDGWNLATAANDARLVRDSLQQFLKKGYADIVPITLTSSIESSPQPEEMAATKENLRDVLYLLSTNSGQSQQSLLKKLPLKTRTKLLELLPVRPEDVIFISFSGHGFATEKSPFYLFPYNTGEALGLRTESLGKYLDGYTMDGVQKNLAGDFLSKCISTNELSSWIRPIDAKEIILVIDACQAGAAVGAENVFRPGPMGDPGFGQLAYDKGISILCATQGNNESKSENSVPYGYLTYSLVTEAKGVTKQPTDYHLWLTRAVTAIKELYQDNPQKIVFINPQIPQLFDFNSVTY